MKNIKMGIIADDFTGAADAASFLVKGGNKVVLCNSIPGKKSHVIVIILLLLKRFEV